MSGEILSYPLTVKHILPGGGVVYHSGLKVSLVAVKNAAPHVAIEVAPDDVRECHSGTVFILNATGTTIETINLT